jgi:hypothetical protein
VCVRVCVVCVTVRKKASREDCVNERAYSQTYFFAIVDFFCNSIEGRGTAQQQQHRHSLGVSSILLLFFSFLDVLDEELL